MQPRHPPPASGAPGRSRGRGWGGLCWWMLPRRAQSDRIPTHRRCGRARTAGGWQPGRWLSPRRSPEACPRRAPPACRPQPHGHQAAGCREGRRQRPLLLGGAQPTAKSPPAPDPLHPDPQPGPTRLEQGPALSSPCPAQPRFSGGEPEAQRGQATFQKPHSQVEAESRRTWRTRGGPGRHPRARASATPSLASASSPGRWAQFPGSPAVPTEGQSCLPQPPPTPRSQLRGADAP